MIGRFIRGILVSVVVLLPVAVLGITLWLRTEVINLEYELAQYQQMKENLLDEQRRLLTEKEESGSVWNLERYAKERLGLDSLNRTRVFYVRIQPGPKPYITGYREQQ